MSTSAIEKVNGTKLPETSHAESWARAGIADAEAEAIRARTVAEQAKAAAEVEAIQARAAAERQRAELAAAKAAAKAAAEIAAAEAEANRVKAAADAERNAREAAERAAAEEARASQETEEKARKRAKSLVVISLLISLPLQLLAFYAISPLLVVAAPGLEYAAWVMLAQVEAAIVNKRAAWHYRLAALLVAAVAAGMNYWHGAAEYGIEVGITGAFFSLLGPITWDLYENGRIRKRDGTQSRRARKEEQRAAKRAAAEKAAAEQRATAGREAKEHAAAAAAKQLADDRAKHFPKVWDHAVKLAADLGDTSVTEAIWKRAKRDIEGTDPGESVDIIRARNIAERRVLAARSEAPGNKPIKPTSPQINPQVPTRGKRGRAGGPPVRGIRRKGDIAFSTGARRQQSFTARNAATEEQS